MKINMGNSDCIIRGVIGLLIVGVDLKFISGWGIVGLFPLLTAYTRICPIYQLLHITTFHPKEQ